MKALPISYITTFQLNTPDRIEIELFNKLSDQGEGIPAAEKSEITDTEKINEIMNNASALPDKGDIMIKMGDVSVINVILIYPEKKLYFTVYENKIKTPDTSFYSTSPDHERKLINLLLSLLQVNVK